MNVSSVEEPSSASAKAAVRVLRATQIRVHDELQLLWTRPDNVTYSYSVSIKELEDCARACRDGLQDLQAVPDAPEKGSLAVVLQALARKGAELYGVLMAGRARNPHVALEFRQWFESEVATAEPGTWRVEFLYQDSNLKLIVPWGLTFTPRGSYPQGDRFDDYAEFWAHKYSTVSYHALASSRRLQKLKGPQFQFSLLIEVAPKEVKFQSIARSSENLEEQLRVVLTPHTTRTIEDLRAKFKERRDWNHFIYLSLRAEGGVYKLEDNWLGPNDLSEIVRPVERHNQRPSARESHYVIAMIDREAIIRGDRGSEWLSIFFSPHWAGLIAVEADITSERLQEEQFGFRFLIECLSRAVPLAQSLREIRRDLWPYSLLYGIYSNPESVFIEPPPPVAEQMREVLESLREGR